MTVVTRGAIKLYYEEEGAGTPLVFLHEFAGDHRSWADQVRHFSRGYRCLTLAARGYPPSSVPEADDDYSQDIAVGDVIAVLDAAGLDRAHIVGLSMGAYTALRLVMQFPDRVRSIVAAGGGSGAERATRERFVAEALAAAESMEQSGRIDIEKMGVSPTRIQLHNKDRRGWAQMLAHLGEHPAEGAARILRNVQARRPSLYDLEAEIKAITLPVLLLAGDEDEPCLNVNLWMKRQIKSARLAVFPGTGHVLNYEEPALFNQLVEQFLTSVERGTWRPRDPRAVATASGSFAAMLGGTKT